MLQYAAYGLSIHSEIPLPELGPGRGNADICIRLACLRDHVAELHANGGNYQVSAAEVRLHWDQFFSVVVRDGREILVDPAPGVDELLLRLAVLGPALAALLHQRGFLLLHASAVAIDGRAIAFLGASGWGKSTLAAALHEQGHSLVADDIIAVELDAEGNPNVSPGFPQLKLWPDTLAALQADAHSTSKLDPSLYKHSHRISEGFCSEEILPLERIYVLGRGESLKIDRLHPREAFLELISHSYGVSWLHSLSGPAHLSTRARLVERILVQRLSRPWTLDWLQEVARQVEDDVRQHA